MKKILKVLFVVLLLSLVITACAPEPQGASQTSVASQIPEAVALLISGVFVTLFAAATVYLWEKFNLDLRPYATPLGLATGTWIVLELQNYINTLPESYDPWTNMIFRIILVIFGPVGFLRLFSRQENTLL